MTASDDNVKVETEAAKPAQTKPKKAPAAPKAQAEPKKAQAEPKAPAEPKVPAAPKAPAKKKPAQDAPFEPAPPRRAKRQPGVIDIGIDVKVPEKTCTDRDCPFHGTLPVRGLILEGDIVSDKMQLTAVVKREYMRKNRKYERLEKRSSKYLVHNPPCIGAAIGDHVKIMECRPLSKKVSFVIVERSIKE